MSQKLFANVSIVNTVGHEFISNNYYCYILIDPSNNKPFYVGKGKGNRVFYHKYTSISTNKHKNNTITRIFSHHPYYVADIVFTTPSEEAAYIKEKQLIDTIGINNLTNLTDGGSAPPKKSIRKILQYDLFGEYIQKHDSYIDAAISVITGEVDINNLRVTEGMILECCRGAIATARDYYWTYEGNPILRPRTKIQPVAQFHANNEYITRYHSASDACQALRGKINMSADIRRAAKKDKTCWGFKWRFINVLTGEFTQEPLKPNKHSLPPVLQD